MCEVQVEKRIITTSIKNILAKKIVQKKFWPKPKTEDIF